MSVYFCMQNEKTIISRVDDIVTEMTLPKFKALLGSDDIKVFFNVPNFFYRTKNVVSLNMACKSSHIEALFKDCREMPWTWYDWLLEHNKSQDCEKDLELMQKVWEYKRFTTEQIQNFVEKTTKNPTDQTRLPIHANFNWDKLLFEAKNRKHKWMAAGYCGIWLTNNMEKEFDISRKKQVYDAVDYFHSHKRELTREIVDQLDDLMLEYKSKYFSALDYNSLESKASRKLKSLLRELTKLTIILEKHDENNNCKIILRETHKNTQQLLPLFGLELEDITDDTPSKAMRVVVNKIQSVVIDASITDFAPINAVLSKLYKRVNQLKKGLAVKK